MLSRLRATGLLWPTLMTIVGLSVIVSLGSWQMQRKAWKEGLIAQIEARRTASPLDVEAVVGAITASDPGEAGLGGSRGAEYLRARVTGRFLHDREQFYYAPHPKLGPGFHVLTPLEITGQAPRVLFVNRGFVPEALKDRQKRQAGLVEGPTTVTGLVRLQGKTGSFTPANDPAKNLWYWRDIPALGRAAFPTGERNILPFVLDAEAEPATPGGWPKGGTTEIKLPNRHLEYALTWYGLAATLAVIYLLFARGRLRAATQTGND
jgi:surfeit locus 1 family protein